MLIENLKKHDELSNIPIIVISSKEDEKDQKRAFQLGASRYIVKHSFNNHNLLEAVHGLIGGLHLSDNYEQVPASGGINEQ